MKKYIRQIKSESGALKFVAIAEKGDCKTWSRIYRECGPGETAQQKALAAIDFEA